MSRLQKQKLLTTVQSQIQILIQRAAHLATAAAVVVVVVVASQMAPKVQRIQMDQTMQTIHRKIQKRQQTLMAQLIAAAVVVAQLVKV
jgi:hypothetical protein